MKKERTYEQLLVENKALKQRIAYLERMLYGSKSDRVKKQPEDDGQLSLFEDLFKGFC